MKSVNIVTENTKEYEKVKIQGKTICLPHPTPVSDYLFIGRDALIDKALAAFMHVDGCTPLNFRLYGPPGVGKNALVYELAKILKKDLYIINGHEELGPEDVACSPTIVSKNMIEYVASPLFAAMLRGGICFFDEIGKAPQSALDPLASVLDDRRSITSVLAGIHLKAHPEFLFCAALNEDEETGVGLPGFIDERTRPSIYVGYPLEAEMEEILKSRLNVVPEKWVSVLISHFKQVKLSPRLTITLLEYAYKMSKRKNGKVKNLSKEEIKKYLVHAYSHVNPHDERGTQVQTRGSNKKEEDHSGEVYGDFSLSKEKETVH